MSTIKEDVQFILSKDCPVQKQSKYISAAGTVVFWLILLLVMAVMPSIKPKEKYKTVQIVLAAPEKKVTPKKESAAAQKAAAAPKQENVTQPIKEPVTPPPAPAKAEQPKTESKPAAKQPAKTQSQPQPKASTKPAQTPAKTPVKKQEVVEYARDMSDGVDFGAPVKNSQATWDDSSFADSAVTESSSAAQSQTVTSKSGISGSAGTQSSSNTAKTSTQTSTTNTNTGVSSGLKDSLGQIADTKVAADSKSLAGNSNVKALVDNGDFKWADGRVRNMWYPASPDIKISPENSPGMAMDIEITFTVTDMGAVTNIQFVQNALLSEGLKAEIRRQISKWLFDEADSSSSAKFLLKLRTR